MKEREREKGNAKEAKSSIKGNEHKSTSEKSGEIDAIKEHVEKRFHFLCPQIQTMDTWIKQRVLIEQQNQMKVQRLPFPIQLQGQPYQMHQQQPILTHQQNQ